MDHTYNADVTWERYLQLLSGCEQHSNGYVQCGILDYRWYVDIASWCIWWGGENVMGRKLLVMEHCRLTYTIGAYWWDYWKPCYQRWCYSRWDAYRQSPLIQFSKGFWVVWVWFRQTYSSPFNRVQQYTQASFCSIKNIWMYVPSIQKFILCTITGDTFMVSHWSKNLKKLNDF